MPKGITPGNTRQLVKAVKVAVLVLLKRRANTASSARKPQRSTTRQCTLQSECYVWILLARRGESDKNVLLHSLSLQLSFWVSVWNCSALLNWHARWGVDKRIAPNATTANETSTFACTASANWWVTPGNNLLGMGVNRVNQFLRLDECRYPTRSSLLRTCTAHPWTALPPVKLSSDRANFLIFASSGSWPAA